MGVNVLDGAERSVQLGSGTVVCFNLSTLKKFDIVRRAFGLIAEQAVFVVPVLSGEFAPVFRDMGVKDYFVAPVSADVLWSAVGAARSRSVEASWQSLAPHQRDTLNASRRTFRSLFDSVRNGGQPDMGDLERTGQALCALAREDSLSHWLSVIRGHHDYTYRHSMFACGVIVHFAQDMGMTPNDLELLSAGGMLHDIGKARVPLRILDKPDRLDEAERLEMRRHPAHSRVILEKVEGLDRRIVAMAVHHHEKLDGTGYPDGLQGAEIDDLVRLTAIADVYSALIDERAYKPAMSPEKAFAWMESTRGHMDLDMVGRFKEFVLDSAPAAASA
jgi:putative nucleotidyltransferase with HDIG domain